jgi:Family of unknown function (DUF5999)
VSTETPSSAANTDTAAHPAAPARDPLPLVGCTHRPRCPSPDATDRYRAHVVAAHPEQGWSLLCNGVIAFDDLGALLPGRRLLPAPGR